MRNSIAMLAARTARTALAALAAVTTLAVLLVVAASPARAAIMLSSDTSKPSTTTNYSITGTVNGPSFPSVALAEDIVVAPTDGPWHTDLTNNVSGSPPQIPSGNNVAVTQLLTNLGGGIWNQWSQKVLTRTTINSPNDAPGFQFQQGSVVLKADYGGGLVPLTQGIHYVLAGTPAAGPGFDPNGWESILITLLPGSQINVGNKLQIQENIFEVFGDGNVWNQGEVAEIAQFAAVPEPATLLSLCTIAASGFLVRRRTGTRATHGTRGTHRGMA